MGLFIAALLSVLAFTHITVAKPVAPAPPKPAATTTPAPTPTPPGPAPTVIEENIEDIGGPEGVNATSVTPPHLPRPRMPGTPAVPAGPTPFYPGNAPIR